MSSKLCKVSRIQKRKAFIGAHRKRTKFFWACYGFRDIWHLQMPSYFSLKIEYSKKLPPCDCLNALSSYNQWHKAWELEPICEALTELVGTCSGGRGQGQVPVIKSPPPLHPTLHPTTLRCRAVSGGNDYHLCILPRLPRILPSTPLVNSCPWMGRVSAPYCSSDLPIFMARL